MSNRILIRKILMKSLDRNQKLEIIIMIIIKNINKIILLIIVFYLNMITHTIMKNKQTWNN